jgi:hypothetical protein
VRWFAVIKLELGRPGEGFAPTGLRLRYNVMNIDHAWLNDDQLTRISQRDIDQDTRAGVWRSRYVEDCPSECYRGSATVLSIVVEGMRQGLEANHMSNEVDHGLKTSGLPEKDERTVGAFLANLNVTTYVEKAPSRQFLAQVLEAELICTAQFFLENRRKGL